MTRYTFTEQEKEILIPLIKDRYISIFETYEMPNQRDMDAINELKDEFIEEKESYEDGILLGKDSRSVLCSIIDQEIISPNSELMSDIKEMTAEEIENIADEYKQIIKKVKYFSILKNKLSPFRKIT